MAKKMFCFLCLILGLGVARVSMTNAKGARLKQFANLCSNLIRKCFALARSTTLCGSAPALRLGSLFCRIWLSSFPLFCRIWLSSFPLFCRIIQNRILLCAIIVIMVVVVAVVIYFAATKNKSRWSLFCTSRGPETTAALVTDRCNRKWFGLVPNSHGHRGRPYHASGTYDGIERPDSDGVSQSPAWINSWLHAPLASQKILHTAYRDVHVSCHVQRKAHSQRFVGWQRPRWRRCWIWGIRTACCRTLCFLFVRRSMCVRRWNGRRATLTQKGLIMTHPWIRDSGNGDIWGCSATFYRTRKPQ